MSALAAFKKWVDSQATRREAADKLGVYPDLVSKWYHGIRRPTAVQRKIVETVAGIPRDDWMTPEEREQYEQATGKTA